MQKLRGCVGECWGGFVGCLVRRKQVDSNVARAEGFQLAKRLSVFDLIAIGVGATIGAGVYILVGTVAKGQTGPAITISFLIAGIAAGLSALCYAELACRCPSAGSAYHYSYLCVGEGVAWLIGWSLILEYTLGGAAVARGISPNMALFFGGQDRLPAFLARHTIFGIVVDPCAAVLVFIITGLLCTGIKESSLAQGIITTVNVVALLFVIVAGGYVGFKTQWVGYQVAGGYFPFGANGVLAGSATVFFSYVGFDAVTSTAEEVKNPQRDLPIGIGVSLFTCCVLYMLVSAVVIGLVPCSALDPDTPIASAFASYGMNWAVYIITIGAVTALCAALIGGILPQPRILMAMARDGLLPSFFSDINKHTHVPVKSTIATGIFIACLAFSMNVDQLAGMVSVGTLLAFTAVAVSILILRYTPPDFNLLQSPPPESIDVVSSEFNNYITDINRENPIDVGSGYHTQKVHEARRRKIAAWNIALVCAGVLVLASAASAKNIPTVPRFTLCGIGGVALLCGLAVLACIDQDDARLTFGETGGFLCPFVPFLPVACILVNTYLLINLGSGTWIRVSVWLAIGVLVYVFYGRKHSLLIDAVYMPIVLENEHEIDDTIS
ncbi:cationic amino acid transporter 4, vacuolar-like isoform X1 [Cynara cardunculus var. scolymus]|uniref:cationic amino acid transporter 4, vacuolar-like isoform X1 n=1 Tax=Cynara cardunculus var. scolymus TaxID=59895 RepID=UPI000D6270DF|nr:cationic amino acid transporter 4, vacuolar-like isoform X1 [Cynara cardunculus var. scolymus]